MTRAHTHTRTHTRARASPITRNNTKKQTAKPVVPIDCAILQVQSQLGHGAKKPILLPGGKVQIGDVIYQIPHGGLGGTAATDLKPKWTALVG